MEEINEGGRIRRGAGSVKNPSFTPTVIIHLYPLITSVFIPFDGT